MKQNLENIKVDDKVIFSTGSWHITTRIEKVTKVTSKQFEVGACRFWKKDGSMIGDKFTVCRLATQKDIDDFKKESHRRFLTRKICDFFKYYEQVNSLTDEDKETIVNIITKYEER